MPTVGCDNDWIGTTPHFPQGSINECLDPRIFFLHRLQWTIGGCRLVLLSVRCHLEVGKSTATVVCQSWPH